jgi:hypothetical protein
MNVTLHHQTNKTVYKQRSSNAFNFIYISNFNKKFSDFHRLFLQILSSILRPNSFIYWSQSNRSIMYKFVVEKAISYFISSASFSRMWRIRNEMYLKTKVYLIAYELYHDNIDLLEYNKLYIQYYEIKTASA